MSYLDMQGVVMTRANHYFRAFIMVLSMGQVLGGVSIASESVAMAPVFQFLSKGGDPNAKNERGETLLFIATNWNNIEAVKALIKRGADPNVCNNAGTCPINVSAGRDTEILRILVTSGANVNNYDKYLSYSALGSVSSNRHDTFERLREKGSYRGKFPNSMESARILISAGANVNHVDAGGGSPLRGAMRVNNLDIARLLIESGADVHQRLDDQTSHGIQNGNTILMETITWYSLHKDIRAIGLLLSNGANPNDKNDKDYDEECDERTSGKCGWQGYTVLTYAAKRGWNDVVEILLRYGADKTVPRNDGKTASAIAEKHKHINTTSLIQKYETNKKLMSP